MNATASDEDIFGPEEGPDVEIERLKLKYALELERLRKRKNLTYKEVASLYGKSAGYISRVFRGDENVTIGTMVKLADVLDGRVSISVVHVRDQGKVWPFQDRRHAKAIGPAIGSTASMVSTVATTGVGNSGAIYGDVYMAGFSVPSANVLDPGTDKVTLARTIAGPAYFPELGLSFLASIPKHKGGI